MEPRFFLTFFRKPLKTPVFGLVLTIFDPFFDHFCPFFPYSSNNITSAPDSCSNSVSPPNLKKKYHHLQMMFNQFMNLSEPPTNTQSQLPLCLKSKKHGVIKFPKLNLPNPQHSSNVKPSKVNYRDLKSGH